MLDFLFSKQFYTKNYISVCSMTVALMLVMGCSNPDGSINRTGTGTLIGTGIGALVGSAFGSGNGRIAGAVIGAGLGAVAGNMLGKTLDAQDRHYQQQAYNKALEYNKSGDASAWKNPDSQASGAITPKATYRDDNGHYCREFTQKINIGSKTEEAVGKACRHPDGSWVIVMYSIM